MLPKNFYKKVEQPGALPHIPYGDTDSIFIIIPAKGAHNFTAAQKWEVANKAYKDINQLIVKYVTEHLFVRCNIDPKYNKTEFKSEIVMDILMFLPVKKQYAYLKSVIESGIVLDVPKPEYKGIQIVKSDAAKMTQKILKGMIDNIILNPDIKIYDKHKELVKFTGTKYSEFLEMVNNYEFQEIGFPGKWSKKLMFIEGMKLYNHIIDEQYFSQGNSGKFIFLKPFKIPNFDMSNMKSIGICVPYEYDNIRLKEKMLTYGLQVDKKKHWEKLFTTTCGRIMSLGEQYKKD